jgi:TM2 domain-containing membrane protein YozV
VGIVSSLSAVLLFFTPGLDQTTYALIFAGIVLGGLCLTIIQSIFYLRSF